MDKEKLVQKSVYLSSATWAQLDRHFGRGKVSANIERILRLHLSDASAEKKAALQKINRLLAEFNGVYSMRLEITEGAAIMPDDLTEDERQRRQKILDEDREGQSP